MNGKAIKLFEITPISKHSNTQNGYLFFTLIQVHFANYSDKEEVLRKSKLLKGGTIHISEDFSRKVFFSRI